MRCTNPGIASCNMLWLSFARKTEDATYEGQAVQFRKYLIAAQMATFIALRATHETRAGKKSGKSKWQLDRLTFRDCLSDKELKELRKIKPYVVSGSKSPLPLLPPCSSRDLSTAWLAVPFYRRRRHQPILGSLLKNMFTRTVHL